MSYGAEHELVLLRRSWAAATHLRFIRKEPCVHLSGMQMGFGNVPSVGGFYENVTLVNVPSSQHEQDSGYF